MWFGWSGRSRRRSRRTRTYLTELDSAIGDADHGINMDRGFQAVLVKLDGLPPGDVGTLFKTVGMTLVSTVGGAGGPLYGTLFLQLGTATAGKAEIDARGLGGGARGRRPGRAGSRQGGARDKTMIDALVPARDAFAEALGRRSVVRRRARRSAAAGEDGHEEPRSRSWLARAGRATWESGAPDTKTPAPRRRSCCSRRDAHDRPWAGDGHGCTEGGPTWRTT